MEMHKVVLASSSFVKYIPFVDLSCNNNEFVLVAFCTHFWENVGLLIPSKTMTPTPFQVSCHVL
jgi:hypothetical protein